MAKFTSCVRGIALFSILFLASSPVILHAQGLPSLDNQASWSEADKESFIRFLESGNMASSETVKEVPEDANRPGYQFSRSKPKFLNISLISKSIFSEGVDGKIKNHANNLGIKLLTGGHLFTWVRYYSGLQYSEVDQDRLNGRKATMNHFEVPLGLELALIPLGTPQTRYIILRGGITAHYIRHDRYKESDFAYSLLGWQATWDLGLGYEWQIANSPWRFHSLVEMQRTIEVKEETKRNFYTGGIAVGMVYTL